MRDLRILLSCLILSGFIPVNLLSQEPAVTVSTREVKFTGNNINYTFAAHSLTQIEITVK